MMDASRKRKAPSNATPSASEGSATKKIKLLNSYPTSAATAENIVQKVGWKLISQLNNATDKTGRSIVGAFLELPSREELPDYYRVTKLPIAIKTIEEKLRKNAYPTVTTLESDFKRMVQNAKDYNEPRSEVYEDAERIRKLIYNFMKLNNPQYELDPTYTSFPTPFPSTKITLTNGNHSVLPPNSAQESEDVQDEPSSRDSSGNPRLSLAPKNSEPPSEPKSSVAPSAANDDRDEGNEELDFTGKTFQEAQQMIIAKLISYSDAEGVAVFTPFINLPSRKLEDYYKLIKHPVSLKSVQKRTHGQHGRNPPTEITDFKTWDAFEQEVSFIWRNAQEYNEDGSDMYKLAGDLEEHFKKTLAQAKEKVKEPVSTRIKLGGTQQPAKSGFTLSLSQHRNSPTPGVSVDNEALARQRQMVQAGVKGQQTETKATPQVNGVTRPQQQMPPNAADVATSSSSHHASTPTVATVKDEKVSVSSPAPHAAPPAQPLPNGMMPPPMVRPPSGSPFAHQPGMPAGNSYRFPVPMLLPPLAIRPYPASQALLPVVTLSTHVQLRNIPQPYSLAITPHEALSQQSTTITLPPTHYYLQIAPTVSRELSMGRAYKIFVTVNGSRLTQRETHFHSDSGKRTHMYEGSLAQGVNRIEVEVAAVKAGDKGNGKGLDVEQVTVFANLLRA